MSERGDVHDCDGSRPVKLCGACALAVVRDTVSEADDIPDDDGAHRVKVCGDIFFSLVKRGLI